MKTHSFKKEAYVGSNTVITGFWCDNYYKHWHYRVVCQKDLSDMEKTEKRSRDNERDLYIKLGQTREEILKIEIDRLKSK